MATAPERFHLQPSCRIWLSCVLLIQLTWILPSTFFLLFKSSAPPRMLIVQDGSASKKIITQGFSGSIKVLHDRDIKVLKETYEDWSSFWPLLKENLSSKGFVQPSERSCFLWLPECLKFAKHERILQVVKEAIGSRVLLYGVTVWKGKHEALHRFHRNAEVGDCEKLVDFVYGASVQLVSQSHKMPERLLQVVLRNLLSIEEESLTFQSKLEQLDFLERSFVSRVKKMIRTPDIWLESLELEDDGHGVFFHGGTLHRVGEPSGDGIGMLLQFISADCKVRDARNSAWGSQATSQSLYMPPVLLVAGDHMELSAVNDVRLTLAKEDGLLMKLRKRKEFVDNWVGSERALKNGGNDEPLLVGDVTVFSEANTKIAWQEEGVWRFRRVGEASTTVIAQGRIERFLLEENIFATKFGMVAGDGEQVIVVLSEEMLYFRAMKDSDLAHYELLELRPGSAVLLSKKLLHALVPLSSDAGFMSFYWFGHVNVTFSRKGESTRIQDVGIGGNLLSKEFLGHGFTRATEGRTITLASGQAYDPDNNEYCDVVVFMVDGYQLQVLPSNVTLQAFDVLLIPAHQSCVLWNIGGMPIKFFALHLCRCEDDMQVMTSFGASGKVF